MKREDLFDAIGHVDEDLLDDAPTEHPIWQWVKGISSVAACLAVILGVAAWANHMQSRPPAQTLPEMPETSGDTMLAEVTEESTEQPPDLAAALPSETEPEQPVQTTAAVLIETTDVLAVSTSTAKVVESQTLTEADIQIGDDTVFETAGDWKSAYRETLETAEWNTDFRREDLNYSLSDIDGDGVPELTVNTGFMLFMYTFADGEVYTLMDGWGFGVMGNAGYQWIPGENRLTNHNSDYAGLVQYDYFFRIGADHQFEDIATVKVCYFDDLNGNGELDEDEGEVWEMCDEAQVTYYLNGEPVTAEEANVYLDTLEDYATDDALGDFMGYDMLMAALE